MSQSALPARIRARSRPRWLAWLLVHSIVLAGLAALVGGVYIAIVFGLGRVPTSNEGTLLAFSAIAAAVAALLWVPARARLSAAAERVVHGERGAPDEALRIFGSRLTRVVPLEEQLLDLAETLRRSLLLEAAEVWIGTGGLLERAASDPHRSREPLVLAPEQETVVRRAGVSGNSWLRVWLPELMTGRETSLLRVAPATHGGELLGLIVAERAAGAQAFGAHEERVLGQLADQLGLAIRNARLDSALQASLDELKRQAEELRASRARVVRAADAERRRIERDLHDGAQQHLVGLAIHVRLARELADSDPEQGKALLEQLGREVQEALQELRNLARGIYPPLLADRGLSEALGAATRRAALRARIEAGGIGRYAPETEATVYFCCLEALQNAAKHAGEGASATVRVWEEESGLLFEVVDNGAGFAPGGRAHGAGLANMNDRLGAIGGSLRIESSPGLGTKVTGAIPLPR